MARTIIRTVVTLLAVAIWVLLLTRGYGSSWGFTPLPVAGQPHLAVVGPPYFIPGPVAPGLQEGDLVDLRTLSSRQRQQLFQQTGAEGELRLSVRRGEAVRIVTLQPIPWRADRTELLLRSLALLYNLLGLLLLWRGRDWVAWGLAAYAIGYGIKDVVGMVAPSDAKTVLMVLLRGMRDFGLFLAVLQLVRQAIPARLARWLLVLMLAVVGVYMALMLHGYAAAMFQARYAASIRWGEGGMTLGSALCAAVMALGYRRSDEANRLRIRWFFVGTVLHAMSFLVWGETLFWLGVALAALAMACLTYAALRHRLVDVSFAISRTLVYGTVVALVVGIFAILEHAIAGRAIGREAGLVLHLVVPLVLGIALHKVRERVEHVIERLFFRRQFEAERALMRLARESAYMEREDRLVARTLHDIARHVAPQRTAIYRRTGHGYERVAQSGTPEWPALVEADDAAFIALRAGAEDRALSAPDGALGQGGFAFPMYMAGRLEGVLVCGDRARQYTRNERELLRRVAREVGTALQGLKAQRSERLLEALARGTLSVREVREQAMGASP
jgi:hypothetical protein